MQTQQNLLQQLTNHMSGHSPGTQQSPHSVASQQHVPQAEAALYMQTAAMYPGAQQNASYQQQAQSRNSLPTVQIPAPPETYATSNAPLESPSLNIPSASQSALNAGPSSVTQDQDFPPYDLLYALTDLYFKHVNTWCPILHRRTTLDSLFGSAALEEADRILLHGLSF